MYYLGKELYAIQSSVKALRLSQIMSGLSAPILLLFTCLFIRMFDNTHLEWAVTLSGSVVIAFLSGRAWYRVTRAAGMIRDLKGGR